MMPTSFKNTPPLCVDLDGTLIASDSLWESIFVLIRKKPFLIFLLPFWVLRGKAFFKRSIAKHVNLAADALPYRPEVLSFLKQQYQHGRTLVLATAAHSSIAENVAEHLGFFEEIFATDERFNLKGKNKLELLKQRFGTFDYMGDSTADLPLFAEAREIYVVAPSASLKQKLPKKPAQIFEGTPVSLKVWLQVLRPHQWAKNALLFIPLFLSGQFLITDNLINIALAFLCFSLVASSGYIINDLLDLAADRHHHKKCKRPFAAGTVPIQYGLPLFAGLVSTSLIIAFAFLSFPFVSVLLVYLVSTLTYSFYLKRKLVLDVLVLAGLYTLRILAGGIATDIEVSSWLLAMSLFLFTSLAFLKRYIELLNLEDSGTIKHRNYGYEDSPMVAIFGALSSYHAVLVFALYISNSEGVDSYKEPEILWLICPVLLYWLSRVWFLAQRRQMPDDPVSFALSDKITWLTTISVGALVLAAKFL